MQKYRTDDQANDEEEEEEEQKKPLTAEEQEAKEMEQLENDITSMKEKERRKLKKKVQQKRRLRQKLQLLQLAAPDAQEDLDLFALDHIKDDRELSSVSAADPEELAMDSDDDDELNGTAQTEGEDNEDEDHESAYLNYIEDTIDSMYAEYLGAKKKKQKDMELHGIQSLHHHLMIEHRHFKHSGGRPNRVTTLCQFFGCEKQCRGGYNTKNAALVQSRPVYWY